MAYNKNIKNLEKDLNFSDEMEVLSPEDTSTLNEQRSCADLYRMYNKNQLQLQPDFQRNFVWKPAVQTRFIDSLVKQLPIPSLCLALDYKTGKYLVIDGLQRISTVVKFFENNKWKLNKLSDIDANISGKSVSEIKNQSSNLYEKVENATMPVTVIKCDFSMQNHKDYLFTIFHRFNTGGQRLNNQEIRNCIYNGNFNNLLKKIAKSEEWTNIMGKTSKIDRLDNEEIILRTFAFIDKLDDYKGNLALFLNHYMSDMQHVSDMDIEEKENILFSSLSFIYNNIDNSKSVVKLGKTLKEGLLVGLCKNIDSIASKTKEEFQSMFQDFIEDDEFNEDNLKQGLSQKDKVKSRLRKSISIFGAL